MAWWYCEHKKKQKKCTGGMRGECFDPPSMPVVCMWCGEKLYNVRRASKMDIKEMMQDPRQKLKAKRRVERLLNDNN